MSSPRSGRPRAGSSPTAAPTGGPTRDRAGDPSGRRQVRQGGFIPSQREYRVASSVRPVDRSALWEGGHEVPPRPPRRSAAEQNQQPDQRTNAVVGDTHRSPVRRRHSWRFYAVPLLLIGTFWVALDIAGGSDAESGAAPVAVSSIAATTTVSPAPVSPVVSAAGASATSAADRSAAALGGADRTVVTDDVSALPTDPLASAASQAIGTLPAGAAFTSSGEGTFRVLPGTTGLVGTSAGLLTYAIAVENGIPAAADAEFASTVDGILADPRSWTGDGSISFQRVDPVVTRPDVTITLTSQLTVRQICGFAVQIESSCYSSTSGRVVINDARWVRGSLTYADDLAAYRQYAINHEVGHAIGLGHSSCPANGASAPTMMQQTWSTSNDQLNELNGSVPADGNVCVPNPWPHPDALDVASSSVETAPTR